MSGAVAIPAPLPLRAAGGHAPWVKICGVTREEDARAVADAGADAVGFNFWSGSKRYLAPDAAAPLVRALPPEVLAVGVFVNPTREEVLDAVARSGVRAVQLHGDEDPALCASLPFPVIKGIRVSSSRSLVQIVSYEVSAFLLDTATPGYGGSGRAFDWSIAAEAAESVRTILAGGLDPENVAEAVRRVKPFGVDVASGVEASPGVKDASRVARFVRAAKEAAA